MMLTRYDGKLVSKIFKETYKRAKTIHADIASSTSSFLKGGSSDASYGNVMGKWIDRLESIRYLDGDENISKQILYLNVISMMCRDDAGQGLYHYQSQAIQNILDNVFKTPVTFGL